MYPVWGRGYPVLCGDLANHDTWECQATESETVVRWCTQCAKGDQGTQSGDGDGGTRCPVRLATMILGNAGIQNQKLQ